MKKICVLGANGMAGHVIFTYFTEKGYDTYGIAKGAKETEKTRDIDVLDKITFEKWLDDNKFDVIINCIGLLNEVANNNIDLAIYLNSYLPHWLETKYKGTSTKIIHMSTDCVFSGKNGMYKENSFKDGDTIYDRTKALGEVVNDKDLTFRMSIIGPRAMEEAIIQNLTGLYHLVPDESISKCNLLKLFQKVFNRDDININDDSSKIANKSLVRTRKDFDFKVNSYEDMVINMRKWVENHFDLYKEIYKELK